MKDSGVYRPLPVTAANAPARQLSWRAWLAVVGGSSLGTVAVVGASALAVPLVIDARVQVKVVGGWTVAWVTTSMLLFGVAVGLAQASLRALRHGRLVHGRLVALDRTSGWRWWGGALRARIQLEDREGH